MGRYRVPDDAWRQATLVLLRYEESKEQFMEAIGEARSLVRQDREREPKPIHDDPTAGAAIRLHGSARFQRLKREVCAVDIAIAGMRQAELEVVRKRFWDHRKGERRVCGYESMMDTGYSRRQMQRIVQRVVYKVAEELGEI